MRAYTADMIPGGASPVINVSQYDNDYAVTVTLIEGAEIYTPPAGATIRVEGTKPDGHGFEYACTYQGNVVTMPIYTQMTAVAGRFPIELVVYQSGLRVGSCNIIFAVERAPLGDNTDISETVIPDIIAGAQAQADAAAASATEAASSAASAETAKDAAMDAAQDAIDAAQELQTAIQFNAALIHDTASGAVASFSDGADDIPMQSLIAEITPVQSGSGDPSPTNIRPISGRTGMTVTRAGKNLLENTATNATRYGVTLTVADNGTITANGTATSGFDFVIWDSGDVTKGFKGEFVLNGCLGGTASTYRLVARVRNTDLNTNRYVVAANGDATVVTSENEVINRVVLSVNNGSELSNVKVSPMLRPATITDDTYEPYTGTTIPITWESIAGTVYGGTLDVVSGVLTVGWRYVTFSADTMQLNGPLSSYSNAYVYRNQTLGGLIVPNETDDITEAVCNMLPSISRTQAAGSTNNIGIFQYHSGSNNELRLSFPREDAYNTVEKVYALGVTCAIPLKEPTTYQLTPTEVRTLLGVNNLWSDAGDVSVEYIADTKLYIDNKIAELQALVLEN